MKFSFFIASVYRIIICCYSIEKISLKQYYEVPNAVGMNIKEAVKELKKFKVEYSGEGDKVAYQSPNAGTNIYEGETIRLLLTQ